MKICIKVITTLLVSFLIISFQKPVIASELTLPKTTINPNYYLLYSFKRLFEKGLLYVKFSRESKFDYYKELTLIRMSELKNSVDNKLLSDIEQSTQRLSFQIGTLSDFVAANKSDLPNKQSEAINILNNLKEPLAKLRDNYHSNSGYWLLLQHNINTIDLNLKKLN